MFTQPTLSTVDKLIKFPAIPNLSGGSRPFEDGKEKKNGREVTIKTKNYKNKK
jgi:hypothetical protein